MLTTLRHDLALLHGSLLKGKLPRNLSWHSTVELIGQLGEVEPHGSDEFLFIVGAHRIFFKRPNTHELGVEDVSRLRTFLNEVHSSVEMEQPAQLCRMVVVIDHHGAHVYQDFAKSEPKDGKMLHPYDPFGFHHHLVHRKEAHYKGEHVPEETSFYEEIAKLLVPAKEIVLIGHGTGKSSAGDFLSLFLKTHHPETFHHVTGIETVDLSALTPPELEAIAKEHMTTGSSAEKIAAAASPSSHA